MLPRAVAVLMVALAGCVSPSASVGDVTPPAVEPLVADLSVSGCVEVGGGMLVSFEHARSLLPDGFEPADAGAFLGSPTPMGRAAVLSGQLMCEGSTADGGPVTWSDLIVPVEAPDVEGVAPAARGVDVYQLVHYTSGEETLRILASAAFPVVRADVALSFGADSALPFATASSTADEELVRFEVVGAAPQPFELVARFWHETPAGIAYFEHVRTPTTMRFGTLSSCSAAPGSAFADAFGSTDCAGPDAVGGIFAEATDLHSTFRLLPGVHARVG